MAPRFLVSVSRGAWWDELPGSLPAASSLLPQPQVGGEAGGGRARRYRDRECNRSSLRSVLLPSRTSESQSRPVRDPRSARGIR
ncbi:hypothetical protein NDU88_004732 [Pleurodeles waltl]|uniref:Uncharacterized protein n=1 Tax=Pleurodeles waltl TaxID=8319 RepID=A0AAV7TV17_PLEWA|nr:hypothetical protein NDU88_004732 [Pleurodeles waltl]